MHVSTSQHPSPPVPRASTSTAPESRGNSRATSRRDGVRGRLRCRADLVVAALSAALLPLVVVVAVRLTDEGGLARILIAVLLAALGASTVYAAAGATQAAQRAG